jgi:hypothetical protein
MVTTTSRAGWKAAWAIATSRSQAGRKHVRPSTNPAAADLLHRDGVNGATWFGNRGLPLDPEATFVDLLMDLP